MEQTLEGENKRSPQVAGGVNSTLKSKMLLNRELFNLKKQFIDSIETSKISDYKTKEISFYNIGLNFIAENESYLDEINLLLSFDKKEKIDSSFKVIVIDRKESAMSREAWENEESQDCETFFEQEREYAIQRDFVGYREGNKVLVAFENIISDGFYNFMRWFLPREILKREKVILHSSCILDKKNEKVFVFLGRSGAGKTTVASLKNSRKVLGDDMNLLSTFGARDIKIEAGIVGGAFIPEVKMGEAFKIKDFYWLIQSNENRIVECSKVEGIKKLIVSMTGLFLEHDDHQREQAVFDMAINILEKHKMFNLYFKKDSSFWDLLDA